MIIIMIIINTTKTCQWQSEGKVSNDDCRNRHFCETVREMLLITRASYVFKSQAN